MIHKTAIIDDKARLGKNVSIGAFSVIGAEVEIGDRCIIGPHVVLKGPTKLGKENTIFQFASVGEDPQDLKYAGEKTQLEIGNRNKIREGVTIHRGTIQDKAITRIGHDNLFMAYVHIAHDCTIGNHNIFANSVAIAGHVNITNHVIFSAFCAVHQFCHIGAHSFIAHASLVSKDVPPFVMVTGGTDVTTRGINSEGLKRRNFSADTILNLRRAYKIIYRQGLRVKEAITALIDLEVACPEVRQLIDFLQQSQRGIVR